MIGTYIVVALVAYLLGSIPFGYILLRLFRGQDVRATGSGNIGATNVARSAPGLGLLTLLLDASKGFVAVGVAVNVIYQVVLHATGPGLDSGPFLFSSSGMGAIAALFAVVGHIFPVWLKFRGGKGVATAVGAFLALAPRAIGFAIVIFIIVVAVSRYVSLGSIAAAVSLPILVFLVYRVQPSYAEVGAIVASSALIIAKHHQNIRRLLAGTEHRFTLKGKSA